MLNKIFGNAGQVDSETIVQELDGILIENEVVHAGFRVFRDLIVFTDKRLILLDKQGITGSKISITSIPYKSIKFFSVETAGTFDLDSELCIWIGNMDMAIRKKFQKGDLIFQIQGFLVHYTTK